MAHGSRRCGARGRARGGLGAGEAAPGSERAGEEGLSGGPGARKRVWGSCGVVGKAGGARVQKSDFSIAGDSLASRCMIRQPVTAGKRPRKGRGLAPIIARAFYRRQGAKG